MLLNTYIKSESFIEI